MLLQTQVSGTLDALAICAWLLGVIVILIGVIWRSNESKANERHQDILNKATERHQDVLNLITGLNNRQNDLEENQRAQKDELLAQKFELTTLRTVINLMQGHPIVLHAKDEKK